MSKRIIAIIAVLFLSISVFGCDQLSGLTGNSGQNSSSDFKIVKAVKLGKSWEMKQMSFTVGAGKSLDILLKLNDGDKLDGYFYLEEGDAVNFDIKGKTPLFDSEDADRFSFVASQAEGETYTLTFRNPADEDESRKSVSVFLEVIYPQSGSIFIPVEGG
jgi:hypothetical protein